MKKWYSGILKDLRKLGDKIFVIDNLGLLNEKNLFKELINQYKIHEYKDDGSLHLFFNKNKEKKILIISSKNIQRDFIDKNFQIKELVLRNIFPDLDVDIIKELDISYYQTLYNDYTERKNQGLVIGSTEDFVLKCVWGIDLGKLHSNTENLKIALAYIVDNKDVPELIINKISKKLSVNISELRNKPNDFISWVKGLLKEYLIEKQRNEVLVYDLSNPIIQFYLIKISMKYDINLPIPSDLISNENWLSKFQKEPNRQEIKESIFTLITFYRNKMNELLKKEFDFNEIDDILKVSRMFCEIVYLIQINDFDFDDFIKLDKEYDDFDKLFREKLVNERTNNYESLFYSSTSDKPLTVDKVLDFAKNKFKNKIALIVMDGMSFDEWFILKDELKGFKITESEIFAIIPTITGFSRTSIFSGRTPKEFMNEKFQFNEEKEFFSAMERMNFNKNNVIYGNLNLKNNTLKTSKKDIQLEHLKGYDFIGIVCNLFDDLSHDKVITNSG
ncbi:MAG: PglZ domain-containing protein, partial [Nanoarchaeota archaeon]|nr:PglZ domain-containing protein [Nanoarchaeota archaeon]